ncbi:Na+/H+ antiporter NhaA [Arenimonas daejeonensis]|uniref:Na+/H+ antiporter NhaA n=1 Tax=Arenimonas daejeonensis TaxID=370777 RepID=UPI0011BE4688|nr:Na+/H+ antiporter NhaA [Arenimonas daejeonensis]
MASVKILSQRAAREFADFMRLESFGGVLLVITAILALIAANSPLAGLYADIFHVPVQVRIGELDINKPLLLWINDGLMAIFFLLVGLELKREMLIGQFADKKQIALPAACAVAGMAVPMGIYAFVNWGDPVAMRGVAIPAATDIAFALGVLALLGSRVPLALKMLLTAIAVADDLGAIIIIALYYTSHLSLLSLGVVIASMVLLMLINRLGVTKITAYLLIGVVMWVAMLKSGVHATLAGVMLGMTIPLDSARNDGKGPLELLEDALHPWVAYGILPLFAFANAGVSLAGLSLSSLAEPVPLGIALGLFVGKQVGIFGTAAAMIGTGLVRRPDGVTWGGLYGMSILCGIGFTMSLFIGALSFDASHADLLVANRIGILSGSLVAALFGYAVLAWLLPRKTG